MEEKGVSTCYVFKSRLQEYAQKVGLPTPVYETVKEGPPHEPTFRSTVIVNDVRYDSLPGFFNRKAAEQSAAEVALVKLAEAGELKERISQPVHETGLCKNLLQEYAQKMNYAIPLYECQKEDKSSRTPMFSCTVDIGGIKYIGAAAKTKKEAEIKAARTALLAIQSSASGNSDNYSSYTVVPFKKKPADAGIANGEPSAALKPKRRYLKKKIRRKKRAAKGGKRKPGQDENSGCADNKTVYPAGQELDRTDADVSQVTNFQCESSVNGIEGCFFNPCDSDRQQGDQTANQNGFVPEVKSINYEGSLIEMHEAAGGGL